MPFWESRPPCKKVFKHMTYYVQHKSSRFTDPASVRKREGTPQLVTSNSQHLAHS